MLLDRSRAAVDGLPQGRRALAYVTAVLATGLTVGIRLAVSHDPTHDPALLVFFAPILLSAYLGGLGPGLLSTALAAGSASFFLLPPRYDFSLEAGGDSAQWIALVLLGAAISLLSEGLIRSREAAEAHRSRLATTLDSLGEGVIATGHDHSVRYLNVQAEQLLGLRNDQALDQPVGSVVEHPGLHDALEAAATTKHAVHLAPWQAAAPVEGTVTPLSEGRGAIIVVRDRSERLRADELRAGVALRERLEQILAAAPGTLCKLRPAPDGTPAVTYAGPGLDTLLGFDGERIADGANALFEAVDARDAPGVRERLARAEAARAPWQDEFRIRHSRRGTRWISVNATPDADGPEWNAFLTDVTERRQAERALRERAKLLDLSRDAIFARDGRSHEITYWSSGAEHLYGFSREAALGRKPGDLLRTVFPGGADSVTDALEREQHWEGELEHRDADGNCIVVLSRQTLQRNGGGVALTILEVNTDITGRKRVEQALRRSQDRFRALVEAAPDLILSVGADGRIEFAGPQATRLGFEPSELVGQPVELLIPERLRPSHVLHRGDFAAAPTTRSMGAGLALFARCKDGTETPVEVSLGPARGGSTTVIVVDVSARRRLEGRLRQAEKLEAVGQLAGGVAHDFNNLLTVITGYGGMVGLAIDGGPGAEDLAEVLRAAERAAQLTGQLLAFSRQQVLDPTDLNLADVVRGTLPMLTRLIGEDIQVVLLADDELPAVHADLGQLEQIIVNLAVNARDAMPTGGTLTIEVHARTLDEHYASEHPDVEAGCYVCLTVTDTGTGIDREVLKHLFEPFFTTKAPGRGTGLGLATVHGIANQSGGHVQVYSEAGFGTSFKVHLPAVDSRVPGGASARTASPEEATGDETVLLCEDEPAVRSLIQRLLHTSGYEVIAAGDPQEALRLAADHPDDFDLLVTDVVMPGMPGPELAARLSALHPGLPVLFISGYTAETVRSRGQLPESSGFLEKPFAAADLLGEVRRLLDRSTRREHARDRSGRRRV